MSMRNWKRLAAVVVVAGAACLSGGTAHAVNVGEKAPPFSLPATIGKQASLADFAGKKTLVLFFYTGAFTNP